MFSNVNSHNSYFTYNLICENHIIVFRMVNTNYTEKISVKKKIFITKVRNKDIEK